MGDGSDGDVWMVVVMVMLWLVAGFPADRCACNSVCSCYCHLYCFVLFLFCCVLSCVAFVGVTDCELRPGLCCSVKVRTCLEFMHARIGVSSRVKILFDYVFGAYKIKCCDEHCVCVCVCVRACVCVIIFLYLCLYSLVHFRVCVHVCLSCQRASDL